MGTDARHTDLYVSAATFLTQYGLHPDPAGYLAHGYVDLCLAGWPTACGAELDLATRWALWTWIVDDVFDAELLGESPQVVGEFTLTLLLVAGGSARPAPGDHPAVRALADLAADTRAMMPALWWQRYLTHLEEWVHAASAKLLDFVQPHRTPTLRQYLTIRPTDGGMLLAAMWCELAGRCVTPDWNDALVQSLLHSFSTIGCLANGLAADAADTFTAVDALRASHPLPPPQAHAHVRALLDAEERRFWWLCTAVRDDELATATRQFARALERFRHALTTWTTTSTRYALAVPQAPR
ncbi:terpene synthase family protein [Kitasatospora sp. NBC_01250]|uniref:terpene synthase family protein n=1 Tax=unclassified Kitasatospora TaxID=2633591 RepID=UPI002E147EE1|nr:MULTISPECIES: terpene synthase family protein [unclassified Kitasatospora]WSJ68453.1 terpene synthase family protein [Kitasatospora sp. NBC_01302]